jgi:hypothetical protein
MRVIFTTCCILLFFSSVFAQDDVKNRNEDIYAVHLVEESVKRPDLALGFSVTEKRINRLGDQVAIALLKIYDADELRDPRNIRNYLPLIKAAFVGPRIIKIAADKKPKVTIFLLKCLENEITDPDLKLQVFDVIKYLKDKTSTK